MLWCTRRTRFSAADGGLFCVCLDVHFLHQVIVRAQRRPGADQRPSRALFESYDELIAEYGVTDPGQAYLRFLFKLGSKSAQGNTLYEKFENLLQQMGIEIEFDDETDDVHGNETNEYYQDYGDDGWRDDTVDYDLGATPRRRASFNSLYDVGDDATQRSFVNRPSSRSSMSRLQTGKPDFLGSGESPGHAAGGALDGTPDRTQLLAQFLDMGRRLMSRFDAWESKRDEPGEHRPSNGLLARSAVDHDRSQRMGTSLGSRSMHSSSSWGSDGEDYETTHQDGEDDSIEKMEVPHEMFHRPSILGLLRDASTFNSYREKGNDRRVLSQWLTKAVKLRQARRDMENVAVNRDRLTLMHQAFATWRAIIQSRQQAVRTERFFRHLEERAGRARDLYLMTKAFTHWAEISSEELARVSAARRHVLGIKYFNAWREVTAVNEMKAQRLALRRPFNAWRRRLGWIRDTEADAAARHDKNLVRGAYWQWFLSFCDRRVPEWYNHRLKKRALLCWLRNFRMNKERNHEIEVRSRQFDLGSVLQIWGERSKAIATAEQEAESRQCQKLLKGNFDEWRVQSRLTPISSQVSGMVDERILRGAYTQWISRVRMLKQAEEIDRQRAMRKSWTAWNNLLRCQALNARIEERLKMETMYKWILAERYQLMVRIREKRIIREVFPKFVVNIRHTYSKLLQRADVHEDHRTEEVLRSKLACWREQLLRQRQREYGAFVFYAPRLEGEAVVAWRSKLQHITKLEGWARDARFYFLMTRTIKRWHEARLESSKQRRQEAYAQTRRKIKINLASKALESWQSKTQHVGEMDQHALGYSREKSLVIASDMLSRWHGKAAKQVQDCRDADIFYSRQTAYDRLTRWSEMTVEVGNLEQQAGQFYHLRALNIAGAQLRKLSLRIFQIRSTGETADSMRMRNMRKHSKIALRHWAEKAQTRLEARGSPGPALTPSRHFDGAASSSGDHAVFDPWYQEETPFKFSDLTGNSPDPSLTPLATPGITSPSKRAARARNLAQISTTPATPLQTPFATRLLRAETGGRSSRIGSNKAGRSGRRGSMATSVRFADQEEPESPTDGRQSSNRRP